MSEPPIDTIDLNERTLNSSVLKTELLNLFEKQANELWDNLETAVQSGQPSVAAKFAHRLAGAAATISAKELSRHVHSIEQALQGGDLEWVKAALPTAANSLAACLRQIERINQLSK